MTGQRGGFRRRELLVYGGAITAAGAIIALERPSQLAQRLLAAVGGSPDLTATFVRAEDFVHLRFDYNLGLEPPNKVGGPARLVATTRAPRPAARTPR